MGRNNGACFSRTLTTLKNTHRCQVLYQIVALRYCIRCQVLYQIEVEVVAESKKNYGKKNSFFFVFRLLIFETAIIFWEILSCMFWYFSDVFMVLAARHHLRYNLNIIWQLTIVALWDKSCQKKFGNAKKKLDLPKNFISLPWIKFPF